MKFLFTLPLATLVLVTQLQPTTLWKVEAHCLLLAFTFFHKPQNFVGVVTHAQERSKQISICFEKQRCLLPCACSQLQVPLFEIHETITWVCSTLEVLSIAAQEKFFLNLNIICNFFYYAVYALGFTSFAHPHFLHTLVVCVFVTDTSTILYCCFIKSVLMYFVLNKTVHIPYFCV